VGRFNGAGHSSIEQSCTLEPSASEHGVSGQRELDPHDILVPRLDISRPGSPARIVAHAKSKSFRSGYYQADSSIKEEMVKGQSSPRTDQRLLLTPIGSLRAAPILRMIAGFLIAVAASLPASTGASVSSWMLVPSPSIGSARSVLADVDILTSEDAWTVGHSFDQTRSADRALVQHWDGTRWSIVPTPDTGTGWEALSGIAALGPKDIWAVGYTSDRFGPQRPLIERWNGSRWRVTAAPAFDNWAALEDVSVISARDAWAVGNSYLGEVVLHWDGRRWNQVPSPNVGYLTAIHAASPTDVWIVGLRGAAPGGSVYQTLVEHWDGTSWSVVPTPSTSATFNILDGVGGRAGDVWAVGSAWDWEQPRSPIALHGDGATWRIVPNADAVPSDAALSDVAVVSSAEVFAVGSAAGRTLVQRWNGSSWEVVPTPSPGDRDDLFGVVVAPSGAWAVGSTGDASGIRTLTLRKQ